MAFNASLFSGYSITTQGDKLTVALPGKKPTITIGFFMCKKGDPSNDCAKLSTEFAKVAAATFSNSQGVTFTKPAESTYRFAANGNLWGYFVESADTTLLQNLTQGIYMINSDYVLEHYSDLLKKTCPGVSDLQELSLSFQRLNLVGLLTGATVTGVTITYKLNLNISDTPDFSLISISTASNSTTPSSSSSTTSPSTTATGSSSSSSSTTSTSS